MAQKQKTLLILGATPYQIPIITKAHTRGHRVITLDNVPGNPAHALADESANVSTIDREAVLAFAQSRGIDGIITGGSDVGVPTMGYVAEQLGLPGITFEQGRIFTRKDLFRAFQRDAGLPHPEFFVFDDWETFQRDTHDLQGQFLIKPVDRSGSCGVTTINFRSPPPAEELRRLFDDAKGASLVKRVILERFLNGVEHGGDLFLKNGQCVCFSPTNKQLTPAPYFVPVGHTIPSRLPESVQSVIQSALLDVLRCLGIANGPVNFDVMVDDQGQVTVLEMSPRFGGNCIPLIMEYGWDFDEIGATIDLALGAPLPDVPAHQRGAVRPTGSRILGSKEAGVLKSIHSREQVLNAFGAAIKELVYDKGPGDEVQRFTQGSCRIGHIIATSDALGELEILLNRMEEEVRLEIQTAEDAARCAL